MIFMCVTKSVKPPFQDKDDMTSDNNRPLNSKSKQTEVDLSSPTGVKREPYYYVESFDKTAIRHSTMLHCQETVADSKCS